MYPSLSLEMRSAQGFHADASWQDDATFGCRTAYDFERTACVLSLGKTQPTNYRHELSLSIFKICAEKNYVRFYFSGLMYFII